MDNQKIPTISREEAKRLNMIPLTISTISSSEANKLNMQPFSINENYLQNDSQPTIQPLSKPTWTDRAKEFGQGVASGVGGLADAANKIVGAPIAHTAGYIADAASYNAKNAGLNTISQGIGDIASSAHKLGSQYQNSNLAEQYPKADFLQTDNTQDKTSQVLKGAGSFTTDVLPMTAAGKGLNALNQTYNAAKIVTTKGTKLAAPWLDKINTFLGGTKLKDAPMFAGAGAGAEMAKSDNPETSETENAMREVLGGIFGGAAVSSSMALTGKKIADIAAKTSLKERKFINKYGGEVNKDVVQSAEKLDLPLTPDLISNNPNAAFLVQNKLRSQFADEAFKETLSSISPSLINSLEDNVLSNIGKKVASTDSKSAASMVSNEAENVIKDNISRWKSQSNELYNQAKDLATDEIIIPSETIQKAKNLIEDLSFGSKKGTTPKSATRDKLTEFVQDAEQGMSARDLLGWKQDLNNLGAESTSYKSLLNSIGYAIDEEITNYAASGKVKNKAFTDAWKTATDFNRENVQNIIKTDAVRQIIQKKLPKEAVDYMTNKRAVSEVEKIVNNPELMGRLKRTTFEKQLADKNIINQNGDINTTSLSKFLNKEKDYVVSLVGKDNYATLANDFMPYLKQLSKVRNENINSSKTSYVTRDLQLEEATSNVLSKSAWNAIIGGSTGGILGSVSGNSLTGATTGSFVGAGGTLSKAAMAKIEISTIKQLSKLASDKKLMQKIIKEGGKKKNATSSFDNSASKFQAVKSVWDAEERNIEANKKRPKGQALIKGLSNPTVQKGAEFLRRSPWYQE